MKKLIAKIDAASSSRLALTVTLTFLVLFLPFADRFFWFNLGVMKRLQDRIEGVDRRAP